MKNLKNLNNNNFPFVISSIKKCFLSSAQVILLCVMIAGVQSCKKTIEPNDHEGNTPFKVIGGQGIDKANKVISSNDGGYLIVGESTSLGNEENAWLAKVDRAGNLLWQRHFGGDKPDHFNAVAQFPDGAILAGGQTESFGVPRNPFLPSNYSDAYLVRTDQNGNLIWQYPYATGYGPGENRGYLNEGFLDFAVTPNGSLFFNGFTWNRINRTTMSTNITMWFGAIKPDSGQIIWDFAQGGFANGNCGQNVAVAADGNIVLSAFAIRTSGEGGIYKTRETRPTGINPYLWINEENYDFSAINNMVVALPNGNIIQAFSKSNSSDNTFDTILLRTHNENGVLLWEKNLNPEGLCVMHNVQWINGYLYVTGEIRNLNGVPSDMLLLKVSEEGEIIWQKQYGGVGREWSIAVYDNGNGLILFGNQSINSKTNSKAIILNLDYNGEIQF